MMAMPDGAEPSAGPSSGDDILIGSDQYDSINAGDGNDLIHGYAGNDRLMGARGDDRIAAGDGNDIAFAGRGDDIVDGGMGNDNLRGGENNDILIGGEGSDFLNGQSGDDVLLGGVGDDNIRGGWGNDLIHGSDGSDMINGNAGTDVLALDGSLSDYSISVNKRFLTIEDADGNIDMVRGVEYVHFVGSGEAYSVGRRSLDPEANGSGIETMFDDELISELIGGASASSEQISTAEMQAVELAAGVGNMVRQVDYGGSVISEKLALQLSKIAADENSEDLAIV